MNKIFIYSCIFLIGVVISSFAQILLKKSSGIKRDSKIKEYLNFSTMFAYTVFFLSTLCTVFAYKYIPLYMGPMLATSEYIFIAILSYVFLKEKLNFRKILGLIVIIVGIIIYSL